MSPHYYIIISEPRPRIPTGDGPAEPMYALTDGEYSRFTDQPKCTDAAWKVLDGICMAAFRIGANGNRIVADMLAMARTQSSLAVTDTQATRLLAPVVGRTFAGEILREAQRVMAA